MAPDTSLLGYALLGLLSQKPASGYDIRRILAETPLETFSNSPGAIYPALRRLEAGGLIRGRVESRAGLRRRRVFQITPAGTSALERWLSRRVTQQDVVRGIDELMLRFAFMDEVLGGDAAMRLVEDLRRELGSYVPSLRRHLAAHRATLSRSRGLALESGIRGYEGLLAWCQDAIRSYEVDERGGDEP